MPSQYKRLRVTLVVVASFAVLGFYGHRAITNAPPITREVAAADGRVVFTGEAVRDGQKGMFFSPSPRRPSPPSQFIR